MRKSIAIWLFCVSAIFVHAQQHIVVCDETNCEQQYRNGAKTKILKNNGITITLSMSDTGKYFRAEVDVFNSTSKNVDVLPNDFVINVDHPKVKTLKRISMQKVVKSSQRRLAWSNAFAAMGAGLATTTSTTTTNSIGSVNAYSSNGTSAYGTYNGVSTSTTTTPDYAAQARTNAMIQERNAQFNNDSDKLMNEELRENTIQPNNYSGGAVLFERDKHWESMTISLPVGDTVYQFPYRHIKK
jgi:hypothetical protein